MAEENPHGIEPQIEGDRQDDVLSQIDQLLNRHRPNASTAESLPALTDTQPREDIPKDDAIPTLTDVVGGPVRPTSSQAGNWRAGSRSSELILRRMGIALDAEHIRLLAQIDRDDAAQARMLGRLVAELKRALPGAVRAALSERLSDPKAEDDGRL
jgi:hypothetical protein